MIDKKWLLAVFTLSISFGVVADTRADKSPKKFDKALHEEVYSLPAPASLDMELETKFRETGRLIAFILNQRHYSHPKFNDELSKEAFKNFPGL